MAASSPAAGAYPQPGGAVAAAAAGDGCTVATTAAERDAAAAAAHDALDGAPAAAGDDAAAAAEAAMTAAAAAVAASNACALPVAVDGGETRYDGAAAAAAAAEDDGGGGHGAADGAPDDAPCLDQLHWREQSWPLTVPLTHSPPCPRGRAASRRPEDAGPPVSPAGAGANRTGQHPHLWAPLTGTGTMPEAIRSPPWQQPLPAPDLKFATDIVSGQRLAIPER